MGSATRLNRFIAASIPSSSHASDGVGGGFQHPRHMRALGLLESIQHVVGQIEIDRDRNPARPA